MKIIKMNGRRKKALEEYYTNPNYCLRCLKIIEVKDHERPSDVKKKKFCGQSCNAIYYKGKDGNNKIVNSQRQKALDIYYKNPSKCWQCGKILYVKDHQDVSFIRTKKFCDHSCAASYNRIQMGNRPVKCMGCGKMFIRCIIDDNKRLRRSQSKYCEKCAGNRKDNISKHTKASLSKHRASIKSTKTAINEDARNVYKNSDKPLKCLFCDFYHVEVCHIRPVKDFPCDATIAEINSIENLVALCPSHHAQFDGGVLEEEELVLIRSISNGKLSSND